MPDKRKSLDQSRATEAYRRAAGEAHEHGPGPLQAASDTTAATSMPPPGAGAAEPQEERLEAVAEDERQAFEQRIAQLEADLAEARAQAAAHWDQFLRARADLENYRKRSERTSAELARSGKRDLLLHMLPVLDNLDRAVAYEQSGSVDVQSMLTGLRMTVWQFRELLSQQGIKDVKTVGEPFDPRYHEAIGTVPATEQFADDTIVNEVQKGYLLQDELLRPARVQVAKRGDE